MSIFEQSKIRGYKFLDRCITLSNYIITFYIEDMISAKTMLDEIIEYYKKVTYDCEIKSIAEGEQIKIEFFNGSIINLITKENMISEICSQVIFMDSRIRETYIQEVIKPKIDQYVLGDGNAMLNPKPIYLQFV
ncbi:hypothetical protein [Ruminococcus sp.]|uniref:hypothetical protein n=1 Tax=Ruminococcus sp. TaxID=41978 RepID=UPI0025FBF217|nr:hypothetical protein [Ruminococcus sp.]